MKQRQTTPIIVTLVLAASLAGLTGCSESEAARRQRQADEIALIEARAMAEARVKAKVEAEAAQAQAAAERARVEAYQRSEAGRRRAAIDAVELTFRPSLGIDDTWVLGLYNPSAVTAEFALRCFDNNDNYKTFPVVMAAGQGVEIGFLEGWPGNFVSGERCQAFYDGQAIWTVRKT